MANAVPRKNSALSTLVSYIVSDPLVLGFLPLLSTDILSVEKHPWGADGQHRWRIGQTFQGGVTHGVGVKHPSCLLLVMLEKGDIPCFERCKNVHTKRNKIWMWRKRLFLKVIFLSSCMMCLKSWEDDINKCTSPFLRVELFFVDLPVPPSKTDGWWMSKLVKTSFSDENFKQLILL